MWDWNGTLLDDAELIIAATSSSFERAGHPPVSAETYRAQFVRPLSAFYSRLLDRAVDEREAAELDAAFHVDYRALIERAALRIDAIAALEAARCAGVGQSLLSMWPHEFLVPLIDELDLTSYFARIEGTRNRGQAGKTGMLADHLGALGLEPSTVLMVGDTVGDAEAAADLGCRCVLIDSGHSRAGALVESGQPLVSSLLEAVRALS